MAESAGESTLTRTAPRPTRPLRPVTIVVLLGLALVMIGRTTGSGWTMVIVSGLVGTIGAATFWPLLSLRRVAVTAEGPRDAVNGRPLEMAIGLSGARTAVALEVSFVYRTGEGPQRASERSSAEVPSRGTVMCVPPRRGVVDSVEIEMRCAAPLGLIWWTRRVRMRLAHAVDVAPAPTSSSVPAISHGEGGDRHRPERRSGHDSVRTVRDYVPGDATRLVHWAVTARRDQLTVKELEDPEGAVLAIVLDLRGDPELAEKMAAKAAGMCAAGLRGGLEVVLCTAEEGGAVSGRVSSPTAAGRRLARAVPGPPGQPPSSARAVHLP